MRTSGLALLIVVAVVGEAGARPPPPPEETYEEKMPVVEWSTWVRVAWGTAPAERVARARVQSPGVEIEDRESGWESAVGAELSLPLGRVRVGPWIEARTSSGVVAGGQLVVAKVPRDLDMFWYEGEGVLMLRAGGNRDVRTMAVAYGYRAPWALWGPWRGTSRYMIGLRMVASVTQSNENEKLWSATLGLETEPVGALRYLLGIRSWY